MWFLNCRTVASGGGVSAVKITDDSGTYTTIPAAFSQEIAGRDLLIGVHGFNVHQAGAIDHLQQWDKLLTLEPNTLFLGGLWPGDSSWLGALEYPFAAKAAMQSGDAFAAFLNVACASARSLSFVSHSLGARVVLETIRRVATSFPIRRLMLMAPAIDDNCLTGEFQDVAKRVQQILILGSKNDDVLKDAFPLGNPISGIFSRGHPYWHAALGREGPTAYPIPNNVRADWLLPDGWNVGHGSYLPPASPFTGTYAPTPYPMPVAFPPAFATATYGPPPQGYYVNGAPDDFVCGWTAGWMSFNLPDPPKGP